MGKQKADYLLRSDHIFTSTVENPFAGYVAVSGQNILAVGTDDGSDWIDEQTEVLELGDQLVTPGFIDVHTFFTGYAIFHIGIDMSGITSQEEFLQKIKEQVEKEKEPSTVFGHGWNPNGFETEGLEEKLNEAYPDRAVIVFAADRSTCMMNRKAEETYGFNPKECYPEAYHKIMPEYLNDREFIEPEFKDYMKLMNSRGVTTVKEMGFDDFYGFDSFLKEKEEQKELSLRTFFMSQPVGEGINIEHGKRMREKFQGDFIRFSGYNRMTDGTVASTKGDLLEPYEGTNMHCSIQVDYPMIEKEVKLADKNGLDEVLLKIEETCRRKSQTPEKIVIAPADLYPKKDWIEFTAESAQKAGGLTEEYRSIAALHHAEFLSARDVLGAECIGCDGIHFTEEGHRILAEAIALIIKNKEADECF